MGRDKERMEIVIDIEDSVPLFTQLIGQIKKAVLGKKLIEGMSEDAVLASWGRPNEKTDFGAGDSRWKYRKPQVTSVGRRTMVYTLIFRRGVLVSKQIEQRR